MQQPSCGGGASTRLALRASLRPQMDLVGKQKVRPPGVRQRLQSVPFPLRECLASRVQKAR